MRLRIVVAFLLIYVSSFFNSGIVRSQDFHTTSYKALKSYRQGLTSYDYIDYKEAEHLFLQAIATDNKFYEAYMMLGELLLKEKRYAEAAGFYQSAVSIDSIFYMPVFYSLATSEMMSGDYAKALAHFTVYLKQDKISEKNRKDAVRNLKNCQFAVEAVRHPVPFSPVDIGEGVNSSDDEYWPSITADGQTIMFTRQSRPSGSDGRAGQEDFYVSTLSGNKWQKAVNAGSPLNTPQNEGAQSLSSDGSYMYFTSCDRPGGMGSCDLYFSAYSDGKWSIPVNLGSPVNTPYWESTPSISSDGRTLYFSSSRPGGFGGKDIWRTTLNVDNKWTTPVNLGKTINTEGDEISPFIHFDGKTLYFSSDGRPGMGGFDIYFSRMLGDTAWSEPQNLGYPINTFNDEMGLVIESGGKKAYFSSKRNDSGGKNIYSFNLYESIRPEPVSYIKGKVTDKETGQSLVAEYELINLSSGKSVQKSQTDHKGNFLVCLPSGVNYGLNISRKGYLFYSDNFMLQEQHPVVKPYIMSVKLSPIRLGEKMLLSNIFFEVDSWQLKKESVSELNKLANLLKDNKQLIVEIGGYTDATGSDEHNLVLSEKRALSVVDYLTENGIEPDRLKYKGYGNKSPVGDNITEEGRKLNRRTEVQIVDFKK
jgi:outer membrane protein OmpA-like peptidoglycan-associated protein